MDALIMLAICIVGLIAWLRERAADRDAAEFERVRGYYGRACAR